MGAIRRFVLLADTFPPLRTSGAVQLRDLARGFVRRGHGLTVLLPTPDMRQPWQVDYWEGVEVVRLRTLKMKDVGYVRRTFAEVAMPFLMRRHLAESPLGARSWDGVIWYSPSIFFGPLVSKLKRSCSAKGYLIVRDIFPQWAADMELMSRGLPYQFFAAVARYQYSTADVIGVQSEGNLAYFRNLRLAGGGRVEVLPNWLGTAGSSRCQIRVADTVLSGRKIFVYAGNMGIAQGVRVFVELAQRFASRDDIGFIFVGRGSEVDGIRSVIRERRVKNVLLFDEIDPDEVADLCAQCHVGLVALDPRHKSHNIPGKFLTYLQSGLPVLASVNPGNDLAGLIRSERVGMVSEGGRLDEIYSCAETLLDQIQADDGFSLRCRELFHRAFSVDRVVGQIVGALCG